jgi:hypothetical protein
MHKIYLRQALMHVWVQKSAEAFKFWQYIISIVFCFFGVPCTLESESWLRSGITDMNINIYTTRRAVIKNDTPAFIVQSRTIWTEVTHIIWQKGVPMSEVLQKCP